MDWTLLLVYVTFLALPYATLLASFFVHCLLLLLLLLRQLCVCSVYVERKKIIFLEWNVCAQFLFFPQKVDCCYLRKRGRL